jgi:pimeloyl-ACP methyl ester carboxylesterase
MTVEGLRFHVQRLGGSATATGGAPIVMAHGLFTGSLASWFFTCAPPLARTHPVLLYDLRGHGRTDRPVSGYTSAVQADDLDALTLDLPPFVLVGHSFGAVVAARFAHRHPDRVLGLALVEPPLVDDDGRAWWTASRHEIESMMHADAHPRRAAAGRRALVDTRMLEEIKAEAPMATADLAALPAPLLVALGRRSPAASSADAIRRARPDADVRVLDGGHALHVDCTSELTDALRSLVADAEQSAQPEAQPTQVAHG